MFCWPQIQREIIPEFRSTSAKVSFPVSLSYGYKKRSWLHFNRRSTPVPETNPGKDLQTRKKGLKLEVTAVMWILFSAPVTDNTAGHEPDSKTTILRLLCSKLVLVLTHLDETTRTKLYSEQITQSRQPNVCVCVADQRRQKHYAEVNATCIVTQG